MTVLSWKMKQGEPPARPYLESERQYRQSVMPIAWENGILSESEHVGERSEVIVQALLIGGDSRFDVQQFFRWQPERYI